MALHREQPAGPLLLPHPRRPQSPRRGSREVESLRGHHDPRPGGLTMSAIKGIVARVRSLLGGGRRMEEEFQFRVAMEAARLATGGLDPIEARRRALVTFGGLDTHREAMRD